MLRNTKILLVLSVALFALIGAFGNLSHWEGTTGAVAATTSMSTFEGGAESWRATSNPAIIFAGSVLIVIFKILGGVMCLVGAWRMWTARSAESATFNASKTLALTGCGILMFMLFMGWIVIAETWFELWKSDALRGPALDSAFRYGGMVTLIALFVRSGDD